MLQNPKKIGDAERDTGETSEPIPDRQTQCASANLFCDDVKPTESKTVDGSSSSDGTEGSDSPTTAGSDRRDDDSGELRKAIEVIPSLKALLEDDYKECLQTILGITAAQGEQSPRLIKLMAFSPEARIAAPVNSHQGSFYFVVSGKASLIPDAGEMGSSAIIELGQGEVFALASALFNQPLRESLVASSGQVVQVLELQRSALQVLRELPEFEELVVKEAIKAIPSISSLASDTKTLQQLTQGPKFKGKEVEIPPYAVLLSFEPGEEIIQENDWECNAFYFVVSGQAEAVDTEGNIIKEMGVGEIFGLQSLIFGGARKATVKVSENRTAFVLEINRSALRILRNIPEFDKLYDLKYREHGKAIIFEDMRQAGVASNLIEQLDRVSAFRSIAVKDHIICNEGDNVEFLYYITKGWIRRHNSQGGKADQTDYIEGSFWLGLDTIDEDSKWPYTATLMGLNEFLEVPLEGLLQNKSLKKQLEESIREHAATVFKPAPGMPRAADNSAGDRDNGEAINNTLLAQGKIISTGVINANDLLVMNMDLCVHCGRCSRACHNVHGQSRLTRRGIHIARPRVSKPSALQTTLIPQACMHCQDAECLKGCPTGAIRRLPDGMVDIEDETCIGCTICAKQCPYDAIDMIVRPGEQTPDAAGDNKANSALRSLKRLFAVRPDPLPATVDETQNLLAVKCDLCRNCSTLNPDGKPQKYSCEENCPTGALVRVNPKDYFSELKGGSNLQMVNSTHAVGRNIHKSDPAKRVIHIVGVTIMLLVTTLTLILLSIYGLNEPIAGLVSLRWATAILGSICTLVVMSYPVRAQLYKRRAWPLRYWLLVHYYAAALAAVLFYIHGGTDWRSIHATLLMYFLVGTVLTGLLGAALYKYIPRLMTRIEEKPLMLEDLKARREEVRKEIKRGLAVLDKSAKREVAGRLLSVRFLLRHYFKKESLAGLHQWAYERFSLASRPELGEAVKWAVILRRVDALIYLHYALKRWLPIHIAFTILMLAFTVYHIYQVIYFN